MKKIQILVLSFIVLSVFLGYLAFIQCSLVRGYQEAKKAKEEITIFLPGEKNEKASGYEARILEVSIDGNRLSLEELGQEIEGFFYDNGMLVGYYGELTIPIQKTSEVTILFLKHAWSGYITISTQNQTESIDLYSELDDTYEYGHNFNEQELINSSSQVEHIFIGRNFLSFLGFTILMLLCLLLIYYVLITMYNQNLCLTHIFLLLLALFIILRFTIYTAFLKFHLIPLFVVFFGITVLMITWRRLFEERLQDLFLIIYPILACLFLFLLPPGHVPDEYAHFIKVYEKSAGTDSHTVLREGYEDQGKVYIYLPEAVEQLGKRFMENSAEYNVKYKLTDYVISDGEQMEQDVTANDYVWFGNTAKLNITSYLPDIFISRLLNVIPVSPIFYFHLLRFIHCILTAIAGWYILKILPLFKKTFFVILLLPMTVQQSVGIGQDWMTNLVCLLFGAIAISEANKKGKMQIKNILSLIILGFLLGNVKAGYFWAALTVLVIPKERFANRRQEIFCKALFLLPCMLFTAKEYIDSLHTLKSDGAVPFYDINFILKNPIQAATIYINTLLEYGGYHFLGGLVSGFGWYTHFASNTIVFIFEVWIFLLLFCGSTKEPRSKQFRLLCFTIFALQCLFIYTSLFLGWTNIGSQIVSGLQPRYFILPLLFLALSCGNTLFWLRSKKPVLFYGFSMLIILGTGVYTIASGFYF